MSKKRALICGISGQDGGYLAKLLLSKGYEVFGTSRDAQMSSFYNLKKLGIFSEVKLLSMSLNDFRSVLQTFSTTRPDEVYNLAGQSSVGLSFEQPVETHESISIGTLNLLEVIRFLNCSTRLYNASSGECFGDTGVEGADESSPMCPRSPYGVAKAAAYWQVANYRDAYGVFACSGLLFNHESNLRPERFVTRKIVLAACRIFKGSDEKLVLGDLSISRDWGWAPEYVVAMWKMLQMDLAEDYVIATGESITLSLFVEKVFSELKLNWKDHVVVDSSFFRPSDIRYGKGNPKKAADLLGWSAKYKVNDVIKSMVSAEIDSHQR
ncbi:MAG: GDP-mannose 4,6-dehydratase [Mariprofundaceae bacterium]|nr:GDP-mannose 4,6-dehydratase [Mariprofundaceae bacterium]